MYIVVISIPYLLPPSIKIHGILCVQFTCLIVFFHNLSRSFLWSTSWPGPLSFILHTFSLPNHCVLFTAHVHTIATCFAAIIACYNYIIMEWCLQCHHMLEDQEEILEQWFFNHYANRLDLDLEVYFCREKLRSVLLFWWFLIVLVTCSLLLRRRRRLRLWLRLWPPLPFYGSWTFSGTTWVSRYQKGKTKLDLLEQEIVSSSDISWAICKSASCPRQPTTPASHHSVFLQVGCPSCRPINSIKALKATTIALNNS